MSYLDPIYRFTVCFGRLDFGRSDSFVRSDCFGRVNWQLYIVNCKTFITFDVV